MAGVLRNIGFDLVESVKVHGGDTTLQPQGVASSS
jgi:hypothetical protein